MFFSTHRDAIVEKLTPFFTEWKSFVRQPYNILNACVGLFFLYVAYEATTVSALIATKNAVGEPLRDIILSHVPRINTVLIHDNISFIFCDFRWLLFILFIQFAPFTTKALAMVIFVRAITINLTVFGIPEDSIPIVSTITFGGDLFFSGHVANTYMLALCFWSIPKLRYFFLAMSILFGVSAVLGHYHYTIDVISAPFYTYGVFVMAKKLFKDDYEKCL